MKFNSMIIKTRLIGGKRILQFFDNRDTDILDKLLKRIDVIAPNAFTESSIESISIPSHIKLNNFAFYHCKYLTSIVIHKDASLEGISIFADCVNLKKVSIANGCKIIGKSCFENTGVEEIDFPKDLECIDEKAFKHSKIKTIIMPKTVKMIGKDAFKHCNLEHFEAPESCIIQDETAQKAIFKQRLIENPETVDQSLIKKLIIEHKQKRDRIKTLKDHVDNPIRAIIEEEDYIEFLEGCVTK